MKRFSLLWSHLQKTIPLVLVLMLYSSTVFAQSSNISSYVFTNNSHAVCVYVLNGHLMYGSNSCKTEGAPTILSQVKGVTSDVISYLVNTDKILYILMLNHYQCNGCNLNASKPCNYDYNGNLIPPLSNDQKMALLDLQANYSFSICPFTQNPSPVPAQLGAVSYNMLDPLEQFRSGVPAKNIECQHGLELITKAEDGTPACVTHDDAIKLTQRGWALQNTMKEKMMYVQKGMNAITTNLKDQTSCQEAPLSGIWYATNSTCVITNFALAGDSLVVDDSVFPSITLTVTGTIDNLQGSITNNGTIDTNNGTINNNGIFNNNGIINANQEGSNNTNDQGSINNNGIFNNNGTVNTKGSGTINANTGGVFTNYGTINNGGSINNYGIFNTKGIIINLEAGTIINYGAGTIINYDKSMIANNNSITNYGTITNYGITNNTGTITNIVGGTIINKEILNNNYIITNSGAISNNGTINNRETMTEYCGSTFTGNPVVDSAQIILPCS